MRVEEDSARLTAMMCVIRLKRVAVLIFHGAPSFHGVRTHHDCTLFVCRGEKTHNRPVLALTDCFLLCMDAGPW